MTRVERILYAYFENLGKMERMRRELARLMSVHGMQMEKNVGDAVVDPVSRRMDQVERLENEIAGLEDLTLPVTRMIRDLPDDLLHVLNKRYFRRQSWGEIWKRKGWSRMTGWRKKKELLHMAEGYLGAS